MGDRSALRPLFRLLSNTTRRRILLTFRKKSLGASELASACDISVKNVRYHLERLMDAGLIELVDDERPYQYRLTNQVRIVRYQGRTVCSLETGTGERKILFVSRLDTGV